ncbi:hypothetical protein [Streptomyces clavuligerus]|uniref:hypothetical protein n=1 Tax=Streptomyces clavuligerus TaxID=1901 RepID=UPI0018CB3A8B|nr:hypothetical protein [Streptomyces clavuligerus]QPM21541.1 hypothetical protein I3J18_31025 [Streptomyces clavuligerus]
MLREIPYGPDHSGRTPAGGARVPVPVRLADGTVVVVAMPGRARVEGFDWIWEHTGWPVHTPGRIVAPPQNFSPAPGLCWEIAAWHDLARDGRVLGEDHSGGISQWQTIGWCTNRADARLVARAFTAHRGPSPFARVDVIRHGPDNGIVSRTTDTYLPAPTAPDAPEHPPVQRAEGPRPASPDRSQVPEPDWYESRHTPPNSSLMVWKGRGTGWHTLVWTGSRPGRIAEALGIGPDGPYEWAEEWRPRYPDQDLHDWTQEGRIRTGLFPKASHQERTQQIDTESRAREDALVDALASRGGLTHDQAIARLAQGGEKYRQLLDSGQAAISRALHTTRRALPQGLGRTAVRWALDDLMERHLLPENAERLAAGQLDIEAEADRNPDVSARSRRAVAEYTAPTTDPAAADIDGFRP